MFLSWQQIFWIFKNQGVEKYTSGEYIGQLAQYKHHGMEEYVLNTTVLGNNYGCK